jgi:hypothetical protein
MTILREEQDVATGTTKPELEAQLAAARARELERAGRLWLHHRTGDPEPGDEVLLAALPALEAEDEAERESFRRSGVAEGDRPAPIEVSPDLALILEQMAASTAATQAVVLQLAQSQAAATEAANKPRETALTGDAGSLAAALDGTTSDGGDGEDPLDEPVFFRSRGKEFKMCVVPRRRFTGPDGAQFFTNGITLDFSPHGEYRTRNRRNVELLRGRPGMDREYWEVGKEPHTAPDPQLVIDSIMDATLALDDAALAEIEAQERASHKREAVLKAVASARLKVQGFQALQEQEA